MLTVAGEITSELNLCFVEITLKLKQMLTLSLLAEPDSPVQIPSLWQGKVWVPFPLIVFYKLRFHSLYCYFHLSI